MKGLLRNNFFAASSNAKVFSIFMILWGVYTVYAADSPNGSLMIGYALSVMVGFSINGIFSAQRELSSKWGKYKLTLPVKRTDIIKSYYISQLVWLLAGMFFATVVICLAWRFHGWPLDLYLDVPLLFALGISVSLFACGIFFPLFHWSGEERGEAFLLVALLGGAGIDAGLVMVLNLFLTGHVLVTVLLGSAAMIGCSALFYVLSYALTLAIYRRKEY